MRVESPSERAAWTKHIESKQSVSLPETIRKTAKGRVRVEKMNKTEMAYEAHLNLRKITGEVMWFKYEGMTLKLGPDCRLTMDFVVMLTDGTIELHDTKGTERRIRKNGDRVAAPRCEDDATAKMAVAAAMFPFVFKVAFKDSGNWIEKTI